MRFWKKGAALLAAGVMMAAMFTGCGKKVEGLLQFQDDYSDYPQATISVEGYGDIQLVLFPDEAPKAVENFMTHAEEGYYDGLTFHRVIEEFMIQGGDPNGDGTGGESIWGGKFDDEISDQLYSFRGALCYANSGPDSNGSQFYIVQADIQTATFEEALYYHQAYGYGVTEWPDDVQQKYEEVGGTPHLDGMYTIFGQVIDGMDVVDEIAGVSTDSNDKPKTDVVITSITVTEP